MVKLESEMIFSERLDGIIDCTDWCDIADDDILLGRLQKWSQDGYWRFTPIDQPLTGGHLKRLATKLSELNKTR